MNDESRKRLTGYLGECTHIYAKVYDDPDDPNSDYFYRCSVCGDKHSGLASMEPLRSFATWPDLGVLLEKIVEKGEWDAFIEWAKYFKRHEEYRQFYWTEDFTKLIFTDPTRFCELVDQWLEGKEKV